MVADLLVYAGLLAIVVAGFLYAAIVGCLLLGAALLFLGLILSDGESPWRARS